MQDRLAWMLKQFPLRAHTFHTSVLNGDTTHEPDEGIGHLHLLTSGSVHLKSQQQPQTLIDQPSIFFYFNPTHTVISPCSDDAKLISASFEFGLNRGNPLANAISDVYLLPIADVDALHHICEQLYFEAYEHHCGRQAILDRLIEVILVLLLRDLMDNKRVDIGLFAGLSDTRLQKALNALHEQPSQPWSIDNMASEAGMSRARFAEYFHQVVGTTPAAYLTELRLGLAEDYLLQGKRVSQTADMVGYASASALSRAFTNRRGSSPKAWAKHYRVP